MMWNKTIERYFFSVSWQNCQIKLDENGFAVVGKNLNPESVDCFTLSILKSSTKPIFNKELHERNS